MKCDYCTGISEWTVTVRDQIDGINCCTKHIEEAKAEAMSEIRRLENLENIHTLSFSQKNHE